MSTYENNEELRDDLRARVRRALPALSLAVIIVAAAVIVAKPWQSEVASDGSALGVISQIAPENVAASELDTDPLPGNLAPNFRLVSIDGEVIELADLRSRPVFLNFWATWCFACVSEMPAMQRISDQYGDDLIVLGVNVGEDPGDASTFAQNNDIQYRLVLDPNQHVTQEYLVRAMPTSVFIDSDGVVDSVRFGAITETEMNELIAPILGS